MHRGNENALRRTAHSCYTTKELLHPPLQDTGSWQRGKAETNWEQVRHQDQRRMLESIMHCFPPNFWWNKITNNKESDKCDLCKALWISQGRFTTESALPIQTLGHIQHTCETLSELHTMTHHRCCRLIHGDLSRLSPSKLCFVCINSEKCFRTVWKELAQEFPVVFDQYVEQTLWEQETRRYYI